MNQTSILFQIFKQAPEDAELRTNLSKNQSQEQNANRRIKSMAPGPPVNHMSKPTHVTATAQSVPQSPRQYANISSGLPYSQQQQQPPPPPNRGKYRPVDVYNPTTGSKSSNCYRDNEKDFYNLIRR
jgi:hypothetical protein